MTFPDEYKKWRLWVAVFGPTTFAYGTAYALGDTLLGTLLALTFCLTVGVSFTRYMARTQARADLRAELQRLQAEFLDVADMVNRMPYEESRPYLEGLHLMEFRIRVLESVLEAKK